MLSREPCSTLSRQSFLQVSPAQEVWGPAAQRMETSSLSEPAARAPPGQRVFGQGNPKGEVTFATKQVLDRPAGNMM
ncbi:hypothetical protein CesoFtcFv8_000015 [Champsocephalus esox]|uniref:Uncharacterized protein n=1 Tax=Champsocephalus esox TaxID=159716 RepID=A0AAN8DYM2_9TELE|nr:hypothetical protein CesoFtcFv8_000015 [Champsocephalus esox]